MDTIISGRNGKAAVVFAAAILILTLLPGGCRSARGALPMGTWNYALLLNGNRVGGAVITSAVEGDYYVTSTELTMKAGSVTNTSKGVITETKGFEPVKLETYNRIIMGGKAQDINTVATFNGRKVELVTGGEKSTFEIEGEFRLEGHYLLAKLMEGKFQKGMEIQSRVYEPSIDPETPVLLKTKVIGRESIVVGGRDYDAVHVMEYIEKFKSFDMFLDGQGVLLKAELTMLNMSIQLIRE